LLHIALLCERWGVLAVFGPQADIKMLSKISYLLNVYRVFKKSSTPGMLKSMTPDENRIMAEVMMLKDDA